MSVSCIPALFAIFAVIIFPWLFTIWMSLNDWQMGMQRSFVGLANYQMLATNTRFLETIPRTLYFTILGVVAPVVLGVFAAEVFHQRFPLRGVVRGIYILPMMTTPVAVALVFIMMYHPQLGILNYLLSLIGIPQAVVDLRQEHGHSGAGAGGDVAVDATGHADRAWRAGCAAHRALRIGPD